MRALDEHHIAVGTDVRVIGFDGIATGGYAQPPLTTIEQDYVQAGEMLVEALIAVLKGDAPNTAPVPGKLLKRGTA
jgi:DNA-binding LacI/PurR family transcriptional regulator